MLIGFVVQKVGSLKNFRFFIQYMGLERSFISTKVIGVSEELEHVAI